MAKLGPELVTPPMAARVRDPFHGASERAVRSFGDEESVSRSHGISLSIDLDYSRALDADHQDID